MFLTVLSLLWIVMLVIFIVETKLLMTDPSQLARLKVISTLVMFTIVGFDIWNLFYDFYIERVATSFILLVVVIISLVLPKIAKDTDPSKLKRIAWTRNILAFLSAMVIFVHFVLFNILG